MRGEPDRTPALSADPSSLILAPRISPRRPGRTAVPLAGRAVSRRPLAVCLLLAVASLGGIVATGCSTVPITGRRSFNVIPDSQAMSLGADAYQQVLSESRLIRTGPEYEMVVRVGQRIAAVSHEPNLPWEFNLIDEPDNVNAFCLPGGKVAVYSGILPVAQNEAGLAVVVGHEIAHAIARHGSERMTNQLALVLGQAGLAEVLAAKGAAARQVVLAAFGAGAQLGVMLPFSRSQESEADRIGLIYMARAGYDPAEAPRFWERMTAGAGARPPTFLSTHPAPEDRVRRLEALIPEARREYRQP